MACKNRNLPYPRYLGDTQNKNVARVVRGWEQVGNSWLRLYRDWQKAKLQLVLCSLGNHSSVFMNSWTCLTLLQAFSKVEFEAGLHIICLEKKGKGPKYFEKLNNNKVRHMMNFSGLTSRFDFKRDFLQLNFHLKRKKLNFNHSLARWLYAQIFENAFFS